MNRLPRSHRFGIGDRIIAALYDLLEGLIQARYANKKLARLESLNGKLDIIRYQTRLLYDFQLISLRRYEFAAQQLQGIGSELGGWIKTQRGREKQLILT